jgi:hypothetical protein
LQQQQRAAKRSDFIEAKKIMKKIHSIRLSWITYVADIRTENK